MTGVQTCALPILLDGGFGSSIAELIVDNELTCRLLRSGIERCFVGPGNKKELCKEMKIDATSIFNNIKTRWVELF